MVFSELLEKFRQRFENSASRASRFTSVPREMVKNGDPGRPMGSYSSRSTRGVERARLHVAEDC